MKNINQQRKHLLKFLAALLKCFEVLQNILGDFLKSGGELLKSSGEVLSLFLLPLKLEGGNLELGGGNLEVIGDNLEPSGVVCKFFGAPQHSVGELLKIVGLL